MRFDSSQRECMVHLYVLNQLFEQQMQIDESKAEQKDKQLNMLVKQYHAKGGSFQE